MYVRKCVCFALYCCHCFPISLALPPARPPGLTPLSASSRCSSLSPMASPTASADSSDVMDRLSTHSVMLHSRPFHDHPHRRSSYDCDPVAPWAMTSLATCALRTSSQCPLTTASLALSPMCSGATLVQSGLLLCYCVACEVLVSCRISVGAHSALSKHTYVTARLNTTRPNFPGSELHLHYSCSCSGQEPFSIPVLPSLPFFSFMFQVSRLSSLGRALLCIIKTNIIVFL